MFIKILLIGLMLNFASISKAAWTMRMPTDEQVEKLCIQVILSIDHDVHNFYYKHIESFNESGLKIKYGRNLDQINFIPTEQI